MVREIAICIVELFENLLEEHNIVIPDEDRPDGNSTPLYGCTYSDLVDDVSDMIQSAKDDLVGE